MHINSTQVLAQNAFGRFGAFRPVRSGLWSDLVVLVPTTVVLTTLASLVAVATAVLGPDLSWLMPG